MPCVLLFYSVLIFEHLSFSEGFCKGKVDIAKRCFVNVFCMQNEWGDAGFATAVQNICLQKRENGLLKMPTITFRISQVIRQHAGMPCIAYRCVVYVIIYGGHMHAQQCKSISLVFLGRWRGAVVRSYFKFNVQIPRRQQIIVTGLANQRYMYGMHAQYKFNLTRLDQSYSFPALFHILIQIFRVHGSIFNGTKHLALTSPSA